MAPWRQLIKVTDRSDMALKWSLLRQGKRVLAMNFKMTQPIYIWSQGCVRDFFDRKKIKLNLMTSHRVVRKRSSRGIRDPVIPAPTEMSAWSLLPFCTAECHFTFRDSKQRDPAEIIAKICFLLLVAEFCLPHLGMPPVFRNSWAPSRLGTQTQRPCREDLTVVTINFFSLKSVCFGAEMQIELNPLHLKSGLTKSLTAVQRLKLMFDNNNYIVLLLELTKWYL